MADSESRYARRRARRTAGRRRLAALLLAVCAVVAVVVFLSVRSGPEAGLAAAELSAANSSATAQDPAGSSAEPSNSEAARLPATLPADAASVYVPILMYHYVDDEPPPAGPYADGLTVRTPDFIAEMEYLVREDHHTVSLADVYLAMAGERELPDKPVVLTFDDGGLDNYTVAFPILQEHGLVGTFFVITKTVGREGQMTWDQLREMAAAGMSIQSHTFSHPDLRGVSAGKLEAELVDSRQAIEEAIGEPSYVLCYPAGAYDDRVIEATRAAGYVMAVSTDKGSEGDASAVYELKRRRINAFLPLETFAGLVR